MLMLKFAYEYKDARITRKSLEKNKHEDIIPARYKSIFNNLSN
jgi:hypothetical protein